MGQPDMDVQNRLDMAQARSRTTLNVECIRDQLYAGRIQWEAHQKMVKILSEDPVFDKSKRLFMNRMDRFTRGLRMTSRIFELADEHGWSSEQIRSTIFELDEFLPMTLHNIAFEPVLMAQASPEFLAKYGKLIVNKGFIGCYLQTELGHGSNVAQVETTATYIPQTREFEIHSPSLTSTKWWIGALGKTATHGVVQARLIVSGGKDFGPHLFFVQLRSLDDHSPLPGIVMGDIGPKEFGGFSNVDNGFAQFSRVRIPKENMLSKFAQVTDEGKYVSPPHTKISYGGMLYIRSNMVIEAGMMCAKAATISIRFTTVRRQGDKTPNGLEAQVISYPSVHFRLLPILSHAYVFVFLGRYLMMAHSSMSARLEKGDTSLLAEVHAIASGLKVLSTTTTANDLEVARRTMGGHGYNAFSGLGRLYADYVAATTYEGDNYVLDKQVVRAALKSYASFTSSSASVTDLPPSTYYLRLTRESQPHLKSLSWDDAAPTSILLLEWRAALIVRERSMHLDMPDANADQRVAKAVTEAFVAKQVEAIMCNLGEALSKQDWKILCGLFTLYLLTTVEAALADLLSLGLLDGTESVRNLRSSIASLCQTLLPEAIGLTDSFGFTDWELDSATGRYDGDVYQALWDKAQTEPLNHQQGSDSYEKYIKPILTRGQRAASKSTKL